MIGEKNLKRNAISLFSSSGIGDLGLKANDITTIIGCDILPERMNLFQHNYPEAKCFCGNIWDEKEKTFFNPGHTPLSRDVFQWYGKNAQ